MKILFIDQIAKVNNKYSFNIIKRLKTDNEIVFISDEKTYEDKEVKSYSYFEGITNKEKSKINKAFDYIKAWRKIYKIVKNEKIDVLHVQWFILAPIDYFYINKIKNKGVKVIVTVHDILPFNQKFYDYSYHKKIYNLANSIIVQAKPNIERINTLFEGISKKVFYVPHGNFIEEAKIIDKNEAKDLLNINRETKVVLFFGQIKKVKGLDVLIKAFNELIKEYSNDVLLLIAGKVWEDEFSYYENLISQEAKDKVRCDIKYIKDEEISWYYSAAEMNVLPYKELYQSGVVHLAYGYETPVIATNVGSFPEVVVDGETGILVKVDDYIELKNSIKYLLENEDLAKNMGIKGKEYIRENFSWDLIVDRIKEIYTKK